MLGDIAKWHDESKKAKWPGHYSMYPNPTKLFFFCLQQLGEGGVKVIDT